MNKPYLSLYLFIIPMLIAMVSCNPKPKDEVTTEPSKPALDCELWKDNQTFINASYADFRSEGEKTYVNKLSMLQLINSLELEGYPTLQERKTKLVEKLNALPAGANNEIEFPQDAIALRNQLSVMIQNYIDTCSMVK